VKTKLEFFLLGKKGKRKFKLLFITFAGVLSQPNLLKLTLIADVANEDYSNLMLGLVMNKGTFLPILEANSLKEVNNSTRLFDPKHSC
jgi:hypothetical protein